jgi:NadR type nicotinamide-nucleotide adenylyltransferase
MTIPAGNGTMSDSRPESGLVFGKFMPPHEGHVFLVNFARRSVRRLTILVCSLPDEPIPGELRYRWMKEMFPDANVVHHAAIVPQEPHEHPDFWNIWKDSIGRHCPGERFDCLFTSEDYGWKMAEMLGARHVPVNRRRDLVPVSGTAVRQEPLKHWDLLPPAVRPYFAKRVCVAGPESTGKSTLVRNLAERYGTVCVEEYARSLLDEYVRAGRRQPGEVRYEDIETIARGQTATEDALARRANRVMFCDTDLLTTVYWSKFYFGRCPDWIEAEAARRAYDLYLLLDVDVPWVADPQRPMPDLEKRRQYLSWWQDELRRLGRPYILISGGWADRFGTACAAVDRLLPASMDKKAKS